MKGIFMSKKTSGFTLIELLVVIVLIGVLSGILMAVIQPGIQRTRAEETVARTNLDKLRLAMASCISTRTDPINSCTTFEDLATNNPSGEPRAGTRYGVMITRDASANTWGIVDVCLDGNHSYTDCPTNTCRMRIRINADNGDVQRSRRGCSIEI